MLIIIISTKENWIPDSVSVNSAPTEGLGNDKLRTLFHELGHSILHRIECNLSKSVKETEAESVKAMVCSYLDLDYSLSDSYIAHYAKSSTILDDIRYTKIIAAADSIIKKVNQAV